MKVSIQDTRVAVPMTNDQLSFKVSVLVNETNRSMDNNHG